MKKLTLLFDMDAILIDLLRTWIGWYNQTHDDKLTIDDVKGYHLHEYVKCTADELFEFFTHERYMSCPVLPGASEALKEFHDAGHEIVITTATAGQTAQSKWDHAARVAPYLRDSNVMVGSKKELLRGDVFVDDAPKNVVKYRNAWPDAHILTIAYPYNQDIQSLVNLYAQDHNNTLRAWQQMTAYIHGVAAR